MHTIPETSVAVIELAGIDHDGLTEHAIPYKDSQAAKCMHTSNSYSGITNLLQGSF